MQPSNEPTPTVSQPNTPIPGESRRQFVTALLPRVAMVQAALTFTPLWLKKAAAEDPDTLVQFLEMPEYDELFDTLVSKHGFDRAELLGWFKQVTVRRKIIKIFKRPAEAKPYHAYRKLFVNDRVRDLGRKYLHDHASLLDDVENRYGVQPELVAAILGIETKYGTVRSPYRIFEVLNTAFALYPRRRKFFRKEMIEYLLMCREEQADPLSLMGSYAGAFGMPQFIPSSFRAYAVDFDGDGKRNIWSSHADVAGSVANYMKVHKWKTGQPIKAEITLSTALAERFDGGHKKKFPLRELLEAGVKASAFDQLGKDEKVAVTAYDEADGRTRHFVLFNNFFTIMRYNISVNYAMVAAELVDYFHAQRSKVV